MPPLPDDFLVGPRPGLSPSIADLVSMMSYVRYTTLHTVQGLTREQLDHVHDSESNSIGALLLHAAAVEFSYAIDTFEAREATAEELEPWTAALELGERGRAEIRGHDLEYYLTTLEEIRRRTLDEFARRDDVWLRTEVPFWKGKPGNYYFMWFHVLEDEINHRGQMRWLRKRLPG